MNSLPDLWRSFERSVTRLQFGPEQRIEFYETLALLLQNRVQLNEALRELYKVASDDGRKANTALAVVCQECMSGMAAGLPLSVALTDWVTDMEASLIAAGEASGTLQHVFANIVRLIQVKKQMQGEALRAVLYPTLLSIMAFGLLTLISVQLVPKLAKIIDPARWEGPAYMLYVVSEAVTDYGVPLAASAVVIMILIFASLPYLGTRARVYLDRIPPWSIYRMLYGSAFLMGMTMMLRSGVKQHEALSMLEKRANPWLQERLRAALYGTKIGSSLGTALKRAGHDFPDAKAVRYLELLSSRSGFEDSIQIFTDRWIDGSLKNIKALSSTLLALGVVLIGVLMLLVVAGASSIQELIQSQMGG